MTDKENMTTTVVGHLLIRDADTGEVLVNQRGSALPEQRLGAKIISESDIEDA